MRSRNEALRRPALALFLAITLVVAPAAPTARTAHAALPADYPSWCDYSGDPVVHADQLLANQYVLAPHPLVTLPATPTWGENPLHDANWQFQYHAMRYVLDLFAAWASTGTTAYRDRGVALLRGWYQRNRVAPFPSRYSWNDHSTAFRAVVFACAADLLPMTSWLRSALNLHGQVLANPRFYVGVGNHALNQSIGLFEVGRVLHRTDWMLLARSRLNALVVKSVDVQGVGNEQSGFYQNYNYARYKLARDRLASVGLASGTGFSRVDKMPQFLAVGTLPNGQYELIGDTEATRVPSYPGTWTEFVATQGAVGTPPPTASIYTDGYLFARTGWGPASGSTRAFADETYLSARWGPPARTVHGHPDGTAITLYAWGSRLLTGPGKYSFNPVAMRAYVLSRAANSVVTADGLAWRKVSTTLHGSRVNSAVADVRLRVNGYSGVTQTRRITWSRSLGYVLVEDRATSLIPRTFRQQWHLVEDAAPVISGMTAVTARARGNLLIRQLAGRPTLRVVMGAKGPLQGWISYRYGEAVAAPVLQAIRWGRSVRYLTLLVPAEGAPSATVSNLRLTGTGYAVTITIGGRSERVVAGATSVVITDVTPSPSPSPSPSASPSATPSEVAPTADPSPSGGA
jgi:hypothetical protein